MKGCKEYIIWFPEAIPKFVVGPSFVSIAHIATGDDDVLYAFGKVFQIVKHRVAGGVEEFLVWAEPRQVDGHQESFSEKPFLFAEALRVLACPPPFGMAEIALSLT